nr:MAG TPA: hypothetical protein [Microviridae sp.]
MLACKCNFFWSLYDLRSLRNFLNENQLFRYAKHSTCI